MSSPSRAAARAVMASLPNMSSGPRLAARRTTRALTAARSIPISSRRHFHSRYADLAWTDAKKTALHPEEMPKVLQIPDTAMQMEVTTPDFPQEPITIAWTTEIMYVRGKTWDAVRPMWVMTLRDGCECELCRDPSSGNKRYESTEIPSSLFIDGVQVVEDGVVIRFGNDIPWLSGGSRDIDVDADEHNVYAGADPVYHDTFVPWHAFDLALRRRALSNGTNAALLPRRDSIAAHTGLCLWDAETLEREVRSFSFDEYMQDDEALWGAVIDLCRLGIVWLRDVPRDERAVAAAAMRIANVQETFYGRLFDVRAKPEADNVAYTSAHLGLHQDLLYLQRPPLIQVLHCMDNSCAGGESLFSDAHRAAHLLWPYVKASPKLAPLAARAIPYHYASGGFTYRAARPVLEYSSRDGDLKNLFWSPPFQAPPLYGVQDIHSWIVAARLLQSVFNAPDAVYRRKMRPGECVLFNNLRVLHGRTAFDPGSGGERWLRGTYIAEEDFYSRAAHMPLDLAAARRGTPELWDIKTMKEELQHSPWFDEVRQKAFDFDLSLSSRMIWQ